MVLNVCRRTLRNDQDVEDAFQATFLVLDLAGQPHFAVAQRISLATGFTEWLTARRSRHDAQPLDAGPGKRRCFPERRCLRINGPELLGASSGPGIRATAFEVPRRDHPLRPGGENAQRSGSATRLGGRDGSEPTGAGKEHPGQAAGASWFRRRCSSVGIGRRRGLGLCAYRTSGFNGHRRVFNGGQHFSVSQGHRLNGRSFAIHVSSQDQKRVCEVLLILGITILVALADWADWFTKFRQANYRRAERRQRERRTRRTRTTCANECSN